MHKIAAIIGTTGVGKSQLAVELCKALSGQVINADAMQVYKGLDIITNKMPACERLNVRHHLMDFLLPEQEYQVTDFKRDATACIEKLASENQFPVIVGGTNYYIQSLLWDNTLISNSHDPGHSASSEILAELEGLETSALYERLREVDPVMAERRHPSDRRKILRSLQVFYDTGRPQSDIYKDQQLQGLKPRFKSLIFWLYCEPTVLNKRLDDRVDKMIEMGLFDEIKSLRKQTVEGLVQTPGNDLEQYQRGLWQAIGYKEFDPYFTAVEKNELDEKALMKIQEECTERMKTATRQYAKRQVRWIRNKLLPVVRDSDDTDIYLLDASNLENWDTNVLHNALSIVKRFQAGKTLPDPNSLSETAKTLLSTVETENQTQNWTKHVCPICQSSTGGEVILHGDKEWEQHRSSRGHRKMMKRRRKEETRKRVKLDNEAEVS